MEDPFIYLAWETKVGTEPLIKGYIRTQEQVDQWVRGNSAAHHRWVTTVTRMKP